MLTLTSMSTFVSLKRGSYTTHYNWLQQHLYLVRTNGGLNTGGQGERSETDQARDGDGRPVGPAHEEPPQDDLVEGSIGAAGQEPVQL